MTRSMIVAALVFGLLTGSGAPAVATTGGDWSRIAVPVAPSDRVIEVVDAVKPSQWKVRAAVNWLDRYTASDMRVVARCSGRAYRCITIRSGTVKQAPIGWSCGSVITIDTNKAARRNYRTWYRKDKHRTWLLIHELGHQFGLKHSGGANVMNAAVNRYAMKLTASQRKHLRSR